MRMSWVRVRGQRSGVSADADQLSVTGRDKQIVFSLVAARNAVWVKAEMLPAGNTMWHGDNVPLATASRSATVLDAQVIVL
jgi:hypothetical protein